MRNGSNFLRDCAADGSVADFTDRAKRDIDAASIRELLLSGLATGKHSSGGVPYPHALRIRGAHIHGKLDLEWCGSSSQPLAALAFEDCSFDPCDSEDAAKSPASIDLSNARLTGVHLVNCTLTHLRGVGMHVDGPVDISGMHAPSDEGPCWCTLSRAVVEGNFIAHGVRLCVPTRLRLEENKAGSVINYSEENWALNLYMSRIAGSITLNDAPGVIGGILLDSARIGGDVHIADAKIIPKKIIAISLDDTHIDGSVVLTGGTCKGELWLWRATIGGALNLINQIVQLQCQPDERGIAIYASGASVGAWMALRNVVADGLVCLHGMEVKGRLTLEKLQVTRGLAALPEWINFRGKQDTDNEKSEPFALDMRCIRGHGKFEFTENDLKGRVDLSDACCTTLDDTSSGYKNATRILIDGFRYERLQDFALDPKNPSDRSRLTQWLPSTIGTYVPHPYVQLAQVLVHHGADRLARDVLEQKARLELRRNWRERPEAGSASRRARLAWMGRRLIYWVFLVPYGKAFKFGLSPGMALLTPAVLILCGALAFWVINARGGMIVAQTAVASYAGDGKLGLELLPLTPASTGRSLLECHNNINPLVYAIDVFIPLIDLREEPKCEIESVRTESTGEWEILIYQLFKFLYAVLGAIVTPLSLLTFSGVIRNRLLQD